MLYVFYYILNKSQDVCILFENANDRCMCLLIILLFYYFRGMTPSEARIIAVALNDDKVFENILRNAAAETEVNNYFTQVLGNFHYTKVYENILRSVLVRSEVNNYYFIVLDGFLRNITML